MGNVLQSLPEGARVVVIRLRSLGDCVLSTPALAILRAARPDLRVAVFVEPRFAPVFEGNPDVDGIFDSGLRMAWWRARLCLNLHGGPRSALLTALSGAPLRAGFAHFRFSFLYNVRIPRAQEILGVERKVHTAEHLASAIFYLGAPVQEIPRAKLFAPTGRSGDTAYAVIHPLASSPQKTWPADRFRSVARWLKLERGLEPVFIAGPGEDLTPFSEWRCVAGAPLSEVKALISSAALFIGNDAGPAHIAAAFGVPVVAIFAASDPQIWGPWKTPAQILVGRAGIDSVRERDVTAAVERLRVAA